MTGKYEFRVGMQTAGFGVGNPYGLPLQFKLASQHYKDISYDIGAMLGK